MPAPKGNKNAVGNNGGRPAMFDSSDKLQAKINEYFESGANKKKYITLTGVIEIPVFTICGLAYFLGFASRQSLLDYENNVEFSDTVKKARLRIEMAYEESLQDKSPAGSIFALKNMGWSDKSEIDHNINIPSLPLINIRTKNATTD
jgi:hypothetical protein